MLQVDAGHPGVSDGKDFTERQDARIQGLDAGLIGLRVEADHKLAYPVGIEVDRLVDPLG